MSTPELKQIQNTIQKAAKSLELHEDFLNDLITESNDWSFVIKCHALMEAITCCLITTHLDKPELGEVLSDRVEMEARIDMIKVLGILDDQERKAMRKLGNLRNKLVHNANQTDFTFAKYFENADRLKNFVDDFGYIWPAEVEHEGHKISKAAAIQANPRLLLWSVVLWLAVKNMHDKQEKEMTKEHEKRIEGLRRAILGEADSEASTSG